MDELAESVYQLHAQLLKALASPRRLMILDGLHAGPKSVGELESVLQLPQATVSQHLSALRSQGLVVAHREGNSVYYSLTSERIVEALDLIHQFLMERIVNAQALASHFRAPEIACSDFQQAVSAGSRAGARTLKPAGQ